MGRKFHAASGQPMAFNEATMADFLDRLIGADAGCVIMSETGVIGGALAPAYCDPDWLMAVELFWWAEGGGMKLLAAFEEWAASVGAQEVRMTTLANLPRAYRLLEMKGYRPSETSFSKVM